MRCVPLALLVLGGVALAQEDDLDTLPEGPFVIPRVQHEAFDDVEVKAGRHGPGGLLVMEPPPQVHRSLVPVRTSFAPELTASADEAR